MFEFLESLDLPLHRAINTLKGEASSIATSLPYGHDEQVYRSMRMDLDQSYRSQQEEANRQRNFSDQKQVERFQQEVARYEREQRIGSGRFDERVTTGNLKPWEEDED